jgi:hypothetical protein
MRLGTGTRRPNSPALFANFLLIFSLWSLAPRASRPAAPEADADSRTSKAFLERANAYVKLRKTLEAALPPLKSTDQAEKIVEHERLLASRIQEARKDARRGDVFTGDIESLFRRRIREAFSSRQGRLMRRTIAQGEPVNLELHINQTYPKKVPLTTVPPTLLQQLPKLAKELEYRIVGDDFVLQDVETLTVVDFIPDVYSEHTPG